MTHSCLIVARRLLPVVASLLVAQSVMAQEAVASTTARPSAASIGRLTITTRDVTQLYGAGFRSFINGVISNQYLVSAEKTAGAAGPNIAISGRVTGFESFWFRGSKASSLTVINSISEYRTTAFPQSAFSLMDNYRPAHGKNPFHLTPTTGLGDEAAVLTERIGATTAQGFVFRRGRYLVMVTAAAQHGTVNVSNVLKLAKLEDQRIQSAG